MNLGKGDRMVRYRIMSTKDDYEQFDDYLEMVIEFGYVTLFASAFPLASILSILCNWVEIKADLFKLTHVVRRPEAFQVSPCMSVCHIHVAKCPLLELYYIYV
jgi:hypothetical protein